MVRWILLLPATGMTAAFLVQLIRGRKYDAVLEDLTGEGTTLSELYGVGLMWQETFPVLGYTGPIGQSVGQSAALLCGDAFREYYTRIALARAYTFCHVGGIVSMIPGLLLPDEGAGLWAAGLGWAGTLIVTSRALSAPGRKVAEEADEMSRMLPDLAMKLTLLISSGMILREAWFYVAEHTEGPLAEQMRLSCERMENGCSEMDAIHAFGNATASREVRKLASTLIQGMERGHAELAGLLTQQSGEMREAQRQRLLQEGEETATKLIFPTTMMFVGIVLVILVSAMGGMTL